MLFVDNVQIVAYLARLQLAYKGLPSMNIIFMRTLFFLVCFIFIAFFVGLWELA